MTPARGWLFVLAPAIWLFGCGPSPSAADQGKVRDLDAVERTLVSSSNLFGHRLFGEVVARTDGNVFVSPLSVSMALGMAYVGGAGATEEAMRSTLGFSGLAPDEIKAGYRRLIDLLTALDPRVAMEIGNSIWTRQGFPVSVGFLQDNRTYFSAECRELDFSSPGAADAINAWVGERTHGKITEIVQPPIDPLTVMFLVNALYFKGTWTIQFDPADTHDATFHAPGGDTAVRMMRLHAEDFAYLESADLQAIDLPYGDGLFRMTILLPRPGKDVDALASAMDVTFAGLPERFVEQEGELLLPRFELEYEASLNDVLAALGMGVAFTGQADFSGINPEHNLYLSAVKHKTYVQVDEEGTQAAAVTSVEIGITDASGPRHFTMRVDRPFLLAIHESRTQALLFIGKIADPKSG